MEGNAQRQPVERIAPVIPLRPEAQERPRSCFICVWSVVTPEKTYCSLFTEQIDQENVVAQDCSAYQDDKEKS